MATDLLLYSNLRMLWTPPGAISNFRSGVPAAGVPIVIEAYIKGQGRAEQDLPGVTAGAVLMEGYITRWATVPTAGTPPLRINWLSAASAFTWTDTGLRPAGLLPGAQGPAVLTKLASLPTLPTGAERGEIRLVEIGQPFGIGGIGDELRAELGDKIRAAFTTAV
jgi:hypothetical protein